MRPKIPSLCFHNYILNDRFDSWLSSVLLFTRQAMSFDEYIHHIAYNALIVIYASELIHSVQMLSVLAGSRTYIIFFTRVPFLNR